MTSGSGPQFTDADDAPSGDGYTVETYGELRPWVKREWILTNGIGGFAAGTVAGVNTRRYHGLLVAATLPPVGRVVALSRFAEVLTVGETRHDLSLAYFKTDAVGDGDRLLRRFHLAGEVATWEYDVAGTKVFRQVLMCWCRNTVGVRWQVVPGVRHRGLPMTLKLFPFVAMRDFHSLRHTGDVDFDVSAGEDRVEVSHRDLRLHLRGEGVRFDAASDWWYAHGYPMEAARGMDDREDLFTPGAFSLDVPTTPDADDDGQAAATYTGSTGTLASATVWGSLGQMPDKATPDWDDERVRRLREMRLPPMPTRTQRRLVRAAADFVVKRHRPDGSPGTTVIAGYPWFSDWGRDTFIALPGLLLVTRRYQTAGQVLSTFAHYVSKGMIPNRFDDYTNEPTYNTVDASLWFVEAAHQYVKATRDSDTYERVLEPACQEIVDGYTRGTRFGIGVDPEDGLVFAGDETTQLTWMDAKHAQTVFTPRHGKAVEINALWYNALCHLGEHDRAARTREGFLRKFWAGEGHGLYDVVNEGGTDASLRPNQIFAVSLPHSPLDGRQQQIVVDAVRRELLTPFGLRTLARWDPLYRPRFTGPMHDRDRAYHNGTVWPWLIGPFLEAHLRSNHRSPAAVERARTWLSPLLKHLCDDGCLGNLSEVFDAEYPYRPGACFAQAWSVAEVLRLAVELDL